MAAVGPVTPLAKGQLAAQRRKAAARVNKALEAMVESAPDGTATLRTLRHIEV